MNIDVKMWALIEMYPSAVVDHSELPVSFYENLMDGLRACVWACKHETDESQCH